MIVKGEKFAFKLSEDGEIFSNNDKILSIYQNGQWADIEALENGTSIIRIMAGTTISKDLTIEIVDSITRPATTLNGSLGEPQPKP
jgi:hypothetical protein